MKQVIIFAGTTEGRELGRELADQGVETLLCVATEYGSQLLEKRPHLSVHQGRMQPEEMAELLIQEQRPLVVDATHPYAVLVSQNIQEACRQTKTEYVRLKRDGGGETDGVTVGSTEEAADWLLETAGNILVTTGSKELHYFTKVPDFEKRVYARVLATPEVVEHCAGLGFAGQHLICMQGPFSMELNLAMLRQFDIQYMVTKESGRAGGYAEKIEAARRAGVQVVRIGRPRERQGSSWGEVKRLLAERFSLGREFTACRVSIVGIGMGVKENMTLEALEACREADCILGAERMLDCVRELKKPMFASYDPVRMAAYLKEHPEYRRASVVLSGDVGFYSGARRLTEVLEQMGCKVELYPGISSVVYLCSRLRCPWEDVKLLSLHGRDANVAAAVRQNRKTFVLLSAKDSVEKLCRLLLDFCLSNVKLTVGERLHYENERILSGKPEELLHQKFDGLSAVLIENPNPAAGLLCCIEDEAFIRGSAPMTKSEIRGLSVSKLRLTPDSIVYDVGAGTGSVAVEMALQAYEGMVYAVERKEEAAELISENARKFQTANVKVIKGRAPEALEALPAPTHAFIGGSSGELREIMELLLWKNPRVRMVINAVTLETIGELTAAWKVLPLAETEIIQVQVSRARALGSYQLMTGQNPVYIAACRGREETEIQIQGEKSV